VSSLVRRGLSFVRSIFVSYSEMLFMQRAWPGVLMLAATFTMPSVGVCGLVSVAAAYLYARFIGMGGSFLESGFFTYNALLVGLGLGRLFEVTPLSLLLAVIVGVMTFNLSLMLNSLFSQYLRLPILSLPFVVISAVVYLASLGYSNLLLQGNTELLVPWEPGFLPVVIDGFLRSLGAILFLPYPLAGLILVLAIFWYSRILFILAVAGYLLGASLAGLLEGAPGSAFLDINNFNFILVAMALGGVFLVPSRQSLAIVVAAVLLTTVLMDAVKFFWSLYGVPAFTLPFNLVTLSMLYVLGLVAFPKVADRIGSTPEETLDDHISRRSRFPLEPRRLGLPFSGTWVVWQGVDGRWTHQGVQANALDFVVQQEGKTYRDDGLSLSDYFSWHKPVLSPIRGRVTMIHDGVPDNSPGELNEQENWGNWVAIDSGYGWHVVLAHFAQESIRVQPGDWVEPGSCLGLCGNSGYSPQPHIHLHVQVGAVPGEVTLPFLVQGFRRGANQFAPADVPAEGEEIAPLYPSDHLQLCTALVLDSRWRFEVRSAHGEVEESEAVVTMNALGETCLESSRGRLFFHRDLHQFYFYRLEGNDPGFVALFRFLPRLPLAYQKGLEWRDWLPLAVCGSRRRRHLVTLARVLFPDMGKIGWRGWFAGKRCVEGVITQEGGEEPFELELSEGHGLLRVARNGRTELVVSPAADEAHGLQREEKAVTG